MCFPLGLRTAPLKQHLTFLKIWKTVLSKRVPTTMCPQDPQFLAATEKVHGTFETPTFGNRTSI